VSAHTGELGVGSWGMGLHCGMGSGIVMISCCYIMTLHTSLA
jgi:hypothetical protein